MKRFYVICFLGSAALSNLLFANGEGTFYVTEDLIPKEDELEKLLAHKSLKDLLEKKNIKRPSKCPIKNLTGSELHVKIGAISTAFKYGECLNSNEQVLQGLSNIASKTNMTLLALKGEEASYESLSELATITDLSTTTIATPTEGGSVETLQASAENLQDGDYYANITNYLTRLSQDPNCVTNLRKQGFLTTLGNIITTIGQTSLIVPSSSGFIYSAAGIGFGTTLKILASLFKSPFNWEDRVEREQFHALNCSFFDLRKDIEASHIFGVDFEVNQTLIDQVKKQILDLENYKSKILFEQTKTNLTILERKKHYYDLKGYLNSYHLYEALKIYLDKTNPEFQKKDFADFALLVRLTSDFSKKLEALPQKESLKDYSIIAKILEFFDLESIMDTYALDPKVLCRKLLAPLLTHLNENKLLLDKKMVIPTKEFLILKKNQESSFNKDIIKKIDTAYLNLLKKIGENIIFLQKQVEILSAYLKRKELDAFDDGSNISYDIIEEYIKVQESIYESYGYPYIEYFRESSYDRMKEFKKINKAFKIAKLSIPFKKELPRICATANQALVEWSFANNAVEVAWDFLETNKSLFYQGMDKIKLFMHVFPVGRTKEYKLYRTAKSAEIAKEILNENASYHKKELEKYGWRDKKNLGKMILKVKKYKKERDKIMKFMKKNQCSKYL